MSDKAKRFELEKGLYAVDTRSGHGDSPSGISGVADRIHKEIEESFNPDAVKRVDMEEMKKEPTGIRGQSRSPAVRVISTRVSYTSIKTDVTNSMCTVEVATSWRSTWFPSASVSPL